MVLVRPRRVPEPGTDDAEDVAHGRRDPDECGRPGTAERANTERWIHEMKPEDEVDHGLRPAGQDETGPARCQAARTPPATRPIVWGLTPRATVGTALLVPGIDQVLISRFPPARFRSNTGFAAEAVTRPAPNSDRDPGRVVRSRRGTPDSARPAVPGICVAVKATTTAVGSSRYTTLKLWKSRPAAPRMTIRRVATAVLRRARLLRHHRPRPLDAGSRPRMLPLGVLGLSDVNVTTARLLVLSRFHRHPLSLRTLVRAVVDKQQQICQIDGA